MESSANYKNPTIRISRQITFTQNNHNGYKYLFMVKTDEIPGCSTYGETIPKALDNFQKMTELWLKWFDNAFT